MCKEYQVSALAARLAREVATAKEVFDNVGDGVCLFGGARVKAGSAAYQGAFETAKRLSERGINVITGGGPGIMEAGNKGAKAGAKGKSIGLNIKLPFEQANNPFQDIGLEFNHFASRKVMFCRHARAFVFFAGGFGTIDELGEVLTLIQTGKSEPVPVILYGTAFWQGLVDWMEQTMLQPGLVSAQDMQSLLYADSPDEVLNALGLAIELTPA